jgi:hypothetical protein
MEVKALANITAPTIWKFFWQNIICRFGVPRELTVDNGSNSIATLSRNTAELWALMRSSLQFITRRLMWLLKEQTD